METQVGDEGARALIEAQTWEKGGTKVRMYSSEAKGD